MNRQIRRFSGVMLAVFALLLGNLFYWQVVRAEGLADDQRNTRTLINEYSIERGRMLVGPPENEVVVAQSVPTDDTLKFLRRYPLGRQYGFVTGFYSLVYGRALAERTFNEYLLGSAPEQFADNLTQLLTAEDRPGGTLQLTLDPASQAAAIEGLGQNKGSVVALDTKTGAVLALTSFPRYDPNELSSHDTAKVRAAWARLNKDEDKPLLNRSTDELYPPGSTFKVITSAAAIEDLGLNEDSPLQNATTYTPPQTRVPIPNFGGGTCKGGKQPITLKEALEVSCNTVFARLGNQLGAQRLSQMAENFGFNQPSPYQLPSVESRIPTEMDKPAEAQSAIGQRDVRVTPLQMASVAATIANDGKRMAPYVVDKVRSEDGGLVRTFRPREMNQAIEPDTARQLQDMMVNVVENGTGTAAQIDGIRVGGKSGTAQRGAGQDPHAWFIAFGSSGDRSIAVAVIIEAGGSLGSEITGGRASAPIARAVINAYLRGNS
jgi:peptidoglycan glycosyltransferase